MSIAALVRRPRENLPPTVDLYVADPGDWPKSIDAIRPTVFASALGTTWNAAGRSQEAFRAVDQRLVIACARAAREAGAQHCIVVSSVGADAKSGNFYLRVKGEVEEELGRLGFAASTSCGRDCCAATGAASGAWARRLAIMASSVVDRLLWGNAARFRSICAQTVAEAILRLSQARTPGKFTHYNQQIADAAAELAKGGAGVASRTPDRSPRGSTDCSALVVERSTRILRHSATASALLVGKETFDVASQEPRGRRQARLQPPGPGDESHGSIKGSQLTGRNDPEINNSRGAETGGGVGGAGPHRPGRHR
jgi:hypothetical protein